MAVPTQAGLGRLLTAEQLAAELGVPRRKVYRWRDEAGLPALPVGRALYFPERAVMAWLAQNTVGDVPSANDNPAQPANGVRTEWTTKEAPAVTEAPATTITRTPPEA